MLNLNTQRLNAFYQTVVDRNFTKAASTLCITQSALSQRIQKLEEEVQTTLLIRRAAGVEPTESGRLLFDYIRNQIAGEQDVLRKVQGHSGVAQGIVRIAAYSSVMRSVIMPAVQPLLKDSSALGIEFFCREYRELLGMLKSGEADFVIHEAGQPFQHAEEVFLGKEVLVHIRNRDQQDNRDPEATPVFLDHDLEDMTTYRFFEAQGEKDKMFYRSFYDDVYGLIDGVRLGFGEAIVSRHLLRNDPKVVIVEHPTAVEIPFSVYFSSNRVITKLHQGIIDTLVRSVPEHL